MHPELFDELVKVDPHHFQDNRDPDPLFRCRYWSPTPGSQLDFYLSSTPIPVLAFWCLSVCNREWPIYILQFSTKE